MSTALFALTAALYAVAGALYLAFLARGAERLARGGGQALGAAIGAHALLLANGLTSGRRVLGIHEALALGSLLVALGFLATARGRPRMQVLGAFVTPVTLLFLLAAGGRSGVGAVPEGVRSALLPVHVLVNVLGVVAFALAFGVALAYLLQERQLRRKQLSGLLQRLPPLEQLDGLGFRLVSIGFPLLSLGVVSGAFWAVRLDPDAPVFGPAQSFGLLAWLAFGAVLLLRVAVGFRGRRAAYGTVVGFLCTCAVLVAYIVRGAGPLPGGAG